MFVRPPSPRTVSARRLLPGRVRRSLLLSAALILAVLAVTSGSGTTQAADPEDRVLQILDDAATNGTLGVYLKEVGGAVIADANESFVFEPASTIKALIHFHAMRQVQDGAVIDGDVVTLSTQVPWFRGPADYNNSPPPGTSCPDLTDPASDTLQNGLVQMMQPSDNRWTQAFRDFFDDANIDATRTTLGMVDSGLNHLIGCGADAVANPNELTLVDAGRLYEGVATGFLDATTRATAYSLMTQDNGTFNSIIDAEAAGLGLSAASIASFKTQRQSANKAGSYGLSTGQYRTVAGWAQIPWKDGSTCETEILEYVYGAFIHGADSVDAGFMGIRAAGVELFREQLRAALESWAACEADIEITSTVVVDPPGEFDVNTPTVLTVHVAMRNNGPADLVDAVLSRETSVPSDCDIDPDSAETPVPDMPVGALVVQEMDFTVECSQPSFHLLTFDSEISPEIEEMVDPDLSNNDGTAQASIAVIARADLAIVGWDFSELDGAGVQDLLVGQDFLFSTAKTLHNFGDTVGGLYTVPVDAVVTKSMEIPAGVRGIVTVSLDEAPADITIQRPGDPDIILDDQPAGTVVEVDGPATLTMVYAASALEIGVDRVVDEGFGIRCLAPGEYEFTFDNSIAAADQHITDPDSSNNASVIARIVDCVLPVQINIRPANAHNQIVAGSASTIPVAILTTVAGEYGLPLDFDATAVDHGTALFGTVETLNSDGGSPAAPDKNYIRDSFELDEKTKDGDDDMVLLFGVPGSGAAAGITEMCVTGKFLGEDDVLYTFFGCDSVSVKG